jgi:NAD(P)-dependent dehydrogenase (short-subunit alcohol dehydrogenase family)
LEGTVQYDLKDKVILITGANSGIGKAATMQFAKLGATVVMACRSRERGLRVREEVRAFVSGSDVEVLQVDLASQDSIHQFFLEFSRCYAKLHVLIHNAATFHRTGTKPIFTEDGFETIFATNYLGPFLLTHLLLGMLKATAPSRVITVASKGLVSYPFLDIEFDNLYGERNFSTQHAYYHSKLAQIIFTLALAERLRETGVSAHCVRVGNVAIPDERLSHLPKWMLRIYSLKRKLAITPEKMAETYVWLATDPVGEEQTGKIWDAPGIEVQANYYAHDKVTWKRLWAVSELMTEYIT